MPSIEQVSTDVANLAVSHCGVSKQIGNVVTERSLAAQMCRQFIDIARQYTLRQATWAFARKQIAPSLITQNPTPEWQYAYSYPTDALRISRFMSWRLRNDTRQSRIEYVVMQPVSPNLSTATPPPTSYSQTTGLWIYTDWPGPQNVLPAVIEYIFDNSNISQWTPDFIIALSYRLASLIVPTLTSGDPYQYKKGIDEQFMKEIARAEAFNLNEDQRPEEPQSEFIRGRDGDVLYNMGMQWVAEPAGYVIE
jgi:hypothetical protein